MQQIIITSDASQKFTTLLGDNEYSLTIWWSDVGGCWYISIYDAQGNGVIEGARLLPGIPVFGKLVTSFVGNIYPIALSGSIANIGRNDWGVAYNLYYLTPQEIASIGA